MHSHVIDIYIYIYQPRCSHMGIFGGATINGLQQRLNEELMGGFGGMVTVVPFAGIKIKIKTTGIILMGGVGGHCVC